jgi:hypothetical protein
MNIYWINVWKTLLPILALSIASLVGCFRPSTLDQVVTSWVNLIWQDQDQDPKPTGTQDPSATKAVQGAGDQEHDDHDANAEDLIKDWDKPDFAIFYSGNQMGYIEPCGCTGLENQKGGLMRRHTALKVLQNRGWDLITIDSGDQVNRPGQQSQVKLEKTLESLTRLMNFDVIGLGAGDFKVDSIELAQAMINANLGVTPFVCANVEVIDPELCHTYRVIQKNGKRVGITMVLGEQYYDQLKGIDGVTLRPVPTALTNAVSKLKQERCDVMILVAAASTDVCRQLATQFPDFDLLITTDCGGEPTLNPEEIKTNRGTMPMVQVGAKSMYVGIVGFYFKPEAPKRPTIRYKRVPLDARFEDSSEVKTVFTSYQNELKRLWLSGRFQDIRPQPHSSGHKFVGSEACADCHGVEYEIWEDGTDGKGGPHKHATASLTEPNERSWVQRHFDPECVSCHMTGWNPQGYFPYESGYLDFEKDQHLFDNGCENCHGPGSAHIDAEENRTDDTKLLEKLRREMRVTLEEAKRNACMECHDLDNSPDFLKEGAFEKYWPKIEH